MRRLSLEDALIQCEISCKKSARILRNVLLSARANAVNNHGLDADKLVVGASWCFCLSFYKRMIRAGKGCCGSAVNNHGLDADKLVVGEFVGLESSMLRWAGGQL